MAKHLVLVGGGHAHLMTILQIPVFRDKGYRVTLVSPSPLHYYSGMGPGLLAGIYRPEQVRFPVRDMAEAGGGTFVQDAVAGLDPDARTLRLASGGTLEYDAVSFNTGSRVDAPGNGSPQPDVFTVKPIENLVGLRARVLERLARGALAVAVVGGGPAALEVAGALWRLGRDARANPLSVQVLAGRRFLSTLPAKAQRLARRSLGMRGVEVLEEGYAASVSTGEVLLETGQVRTADVIVLATGIAPSVSLGSCGLPTAPGGWLAVNRFLQSPAYPEVFGGGDGIHFQDRSLDKVGVYAVRQNPVLRDNLLGFLDGRILRPFHPGPPTYLLIFNLGDGTAIFRKGSMVYQGRTAWLLKDYIDRRFMRRFRP
ncbi:MAG: FAD-dependent oxidoreductase [Thermodesulfobacteriota bacterium]